VDETKDTSQKLQKNRGDQSFLFFLVAILAGFNPILK
jgi:hypothetical protein